MAAATPRGNVKFHSFGEHDTNPFQDAVVLRMNANLI